MAELSGRCLAGNDSLKTSAASARSRKPDGERVCDVEIGGAVQPAADLQRSPPGSHDCCHLGGFGDTGTAGWGRLWINLCLDYQRLLKRARSRSCLA
jgi:hypothetical protein